MPGWEPTPDGIIICHGPTIFEDLIDIGPIPPETFIVVVNHAITMLRLGRNVDLIANDWVPTMLVPWAHHPDTEKIRAIICHNANPLWQPYHIDRPRLFYRVAKEKKIKLNPDKSVGGYGFTIWRALHWCVNHGCKRIYGAGLPMCHTVDGRYQLDAPPNWALKEVFEQLHDQWYNIKQDLDESGIIFRCRGVANG